MTERVWRVNERLINGRESLDLVDSGVWVTDKNDKVQIASPILEANENVFKQIAFQLKGF